MGFVTFYIYIQFQKLHILRYKQFILSRYFCFCLFRSKMLPSVLQTIGLPYLLRIFRKATLFSATHKYSPSTGYISTHNLFVQIDVSSGKLSLLKKLYQLIYIFSVSRFDAKYFILIFIKYSLGFLS